MVVEPPDSDAIASGHLRLWEWIAYQLLHRSRWFVVLALYVIAAILMLRRDDVWLSCLALLPGSAAGSLAGGAQARSLVAPRDPSRENEPTRSELIVLWIASTVSAAAGLVAIGLIADAGLQASTTASQVVGVIPTTIAFATMMVRSRVLITVPFGQLIAFFAHTDAPPIERRDTLLWLQALPIYVAATTLMFAAWTGFYYEMGWIDSAGAIAGSTLIASLSWYCWQLLDLVPFLELAESLHLEPTVTFTDRCSGVLVIIFKLLVVAPVSAFAVMVLRAHTIQTMRHDEQTM